MSGDIERFISACRAQEKRERESLKRMYPIEFADGAKRGFTGNNLYPRDLHHWPTEKRSAWFAGWNVGYCDRKRAEGGDGR